MSDFARSAAISSRRPSGWPCFIGSVPERARKSTFRWLPSTSSTTSGTGARRSGKGARLSPDAEAASPALSDQGRLYLHSRDDRRVIAAPVRSDRSTRTGRRRTVLDLARRADNIGELYEIVIERMRRRTHCQWRRRLDAFDVPNGVVTDLEGLLADPYLAETEFFAPVEHPSEGKMLTMAMPVMFSGSPGDSFRLPPPRLGEHTRSVLGDLGLSKAEINEIEV